jgi:Fe2+ or Zn2+ uptake regulation protein
MDGDIHNISDKEHVLHAGGFRVTSTRVNLLQLLEHVDKPLSIQRIVTLWKGKAPNTTTLYRSLTDLTEAGIVRRIDLNTGIAHFEYTPHRSHHHHIICNSCGRVEEFNHCSLSSIEKDMTQKSEYFKSIYSHNLEFFGHCTTCTVKK